LRAPGAWQADARAAIGGGKAVISPNVKVDAAGASLDVPLGHKDDSWSFPRFDTITVSVADAPRPNERRRRTATEPMRQRAYQMIGRTARRRMTDRRLSPRCNCDGAPRDVRNLKNDRIGVPADRPIFDYLIDHPATD
jgi:Amino acid synthesis